MDGLADLPARHSTGLVALSAGHPHRPLWVLDFFQAHADLGIQRLRVRHHRFPAVFSIHAHSRTIPLRYASARSSQSPQPHGHIWHPLSAKSRNELLCLSELSVIIGAQRNLLHSTDFPAAERGKWSADFSPMPLRIRICSRFFIHAEICALSADGEKDCPVSQRDTALQPRVGTARSYPGSPPRAIIQPQRGCAHAWREIGQSTGAQPRWG